MSCSINTIQLTKSKTSADQGGSGWASADTQATLDGPESRPTCE
jgi:hypothetical protein